jgi:hypothetical protein
VKELIHDNVEEMKLRRRMRVGEIMASGYEDEDDEFGVE